MVLLKSTQVTGSYNEDSFYFERRKLETAKMVLNGQSLPSENGYQVNPTKHNMKKAFMQFCQNVGIGNLDSNCGITVDSWLKKEFVLAWDFSALHYRGQISEPPLKGEISVELEFATQSDTGINALFIAIYDSWLFLNLQSTLDGSAKILDYAA